MRLGGISEVAEELGVSTQRIATLRQRNDFPDAVGEIAQGPIWDLDVVAGWNSSGLRQTKAGRPKSDEKTRTLGGRFLLEHARIGGGGFADVFRATDRKTSELVAVKVLKDTVAVDPEAIKRFRRELRLLEDLHHPNVISVLAHGETDDDNIWYAMPLAQGSLTDYVDTVGGQARLIVDIMRQICTGLGYVHDRGIYHRDLKPANVLRLSNGDWAVSDFGIAVEAERHTDPLTSTLRQGLGTWVYTAPEQWQRARSADHRSDIYGLGKILQELVTQDFPVNNEVEPGPLRPVIETAIANSPDRRYQSIEHFMNALERAVDAHEEYVANESKEEAAERLQDRMRSPSVADADLIEMIEWAAALDESSHDDMHVLTRVLPWCTRGSVKFLWSEQRGAFQRVYQRFTDFLRHGNFSFEYCDVLADFTRIVVAETKDSSVMRMSVGALASLGPRHNRWHVRDVLVKILQEVKSDEMASAAVEALRAADADDVEWSISDFAIRTLPPAIRSGVEKLRPPKSSAS
ncbi:serine/threonine protein kinase [Mycobacterium intracellulare subsp. chimaera]|nr:serine/threonine protein kinase [Mycobacterium intracellulare subsp. chimaera]